MADVRHLIQRAAFDAPPHGAEAQIHRRVRDAQRQRVQRRETFGRRAVCARQVHRRRVAVGFQCHDEAMLPVAIEVVGGKTVLWIGQGIEPHHAGASADADALQRQPHTLGCGRWVRRERVRRDRDVRLPEELPRPPVDHIRQHTCHGPRDERQRALRSGRHAGGGHAEEDIGDGVHAGSFVRRLRR